MTDEELCEKYDCVLLQVQGSREIIHKNNPSSRITGIFVPLVLMQMRERDAQARSA